ncbi:hypothetical protein JWG41_14675 [Leptospira sp. 201903075]|uniref:hypothetical protein n=1 Tax=Leptospira chreensis TaxID=2810035 RepID=UPI0019658572|nr:hypothetical protein [Leptospira chreensis]MBM9591700.1 hypothetical protein [Leptospira chreensis]
MRNAKPKYLKMTNNLTKKSQTIIENKNFLLLILRKISHFYALATLLSFIFYTIFKIYDITPSIFFICGMIISITILEFGYYIMIITATKTTAILLFYSRSLTIGFVASILSKSHNDPCFIFIQLSYVFMFVTLYFIFKLLEINLQKLSIVKIIIPYILLSSIIIPIAINQYFVLHWVIVFVYSFPYLIIFSFYYKASLKFNRIGNENTPEDKMEILLATLFIIDSISFFRKTFLGKNSEATRNPYYIN